MKSRNFLYLSILILIDDGVEYSRVDFRRRNFSDFNEEDSDPSPRKILKYNVNP